METVEIVQAQQVLEVLKSDPALARATREYLARQSRASHPDGRFDKGGRWFPSGSEEQICCRSIRTPSRAWPNSLNKHCRSIDHVANLFGVDAKELRRATR